MDSFHMHFSGLECDTPEEAWETWRVEAESIFKWVKGPKIWRAAPELFTDKNFSTLEPIYQVRARIIALEELPVGMVEATIDEPYVCQTADLESKYYGMQGFAIQ